MCGWIKRIVDTGNFATVVYITTTSNADFEMFIGTESGGDQLQADIFPTQTTLASGTTLTLNTWFFWAYAQDANNQNFYLGTEAGGTLSNWNATQARSPANEIQTMRFANDIFSEPFDGELAYFRMWDGTRLSAAQFDAEWRSTTPVLTTNLYGDWQIATAAAAGTDASGNGNNMTINGTLDDGVNNPTPPAAGTGGSPLLMPKFFRYQRM